MPVLILAGDEEFELSRRVQSLKQSLLDPGWMSFNYCRLDNPFLEEIADASATLPFGPGNRVVLIDRCELFTKKRGKGGEEEAPKAGKGAKGKDASKGKDKETQLDAFEAALANVAPNTYVIFSCPFNFDSTLKTSKAAAKNATLEPFNKQKFYIGSPNAVLETWVRKEAKRYGATIEDNAITYLLDGTEADLRQISNELEKASVHILPATHITRETVVRLSPYHSHVFTLAEKWISGKNKEALTSAEELLSRQSAMPIIAMMQTMMSKWINMRALCDKHNSELPSGPGINRRELSLSDQVKRVSAETKMHTYVVEMDLKRLSKVSTATLIAKRLELTRLEDSVKSGMIPETHALQIFLAG